MSERYANRSVNGGFNYAPDIASENVLSKYALNEEISVVARIVNLVFASEEGFRIYEVEEHDRWYTASGTFPVALNLNGYYELAGTVTEYKGQKQLSVHSFRSTIPTDSNGIINVLRTLYGLDARARELYSIFGKDIINIIKENPKEIVKRIRGIGEKTVLNWQAQLLNNEAIDEAIVLLLGYGISPAHAKLLFEEYGVAITSIIQERPYTLIGKVPSLTFAKCDAMALKNGYPLNGVSRVEAAMVNALNTAAIRSGHCCLPKLDFFIEYEKQANLSLSYREAQALIKNAGNINPFPYSVYGVNMSIDVGALKTAMHDFANSRKRTSFSFTIFKIDAAIAVEALSNLLTRRELIDFEMDGRPYYFLSKFWEAEGVIASKVRSIQAAQMSVYRGVDAAVARFCDKNKVVFEAKQELAVRTFCAQQGGIYILTGPAGGGKTFTLNAVVSVLKTVTNGAYSVKILAPTGKAAKVAQKATGVNAFTIHRELGLVSDNAVSSYDPSASSGLFADCLIIDEFSMADALLSGKLFDSIRPTTKIIITGDIEQLPSIGAGSVLKSLINCGVITVVTLDVVKRQGQGSGILINANKIVSGEMIASETPNDKSFSRNAYIVRRDDPFECRAYMLQLFAKCLGLKGMRLDDIQVLCPQKKTDIGADVLNYLIQQMVNPERPGEPKVFARDITFRARSYDKPQEIKTFFRTGDRVIHIRNNYDASWYVLLGDESSTASKAITEDTLVLNPVKRGIVNGECGTIAAILEIRKDGEVRHKVVVRYDAGYVVYSGDYSEIQHAYALTIHKSQGSQWSIVISPIMMHNRTMLSRKLLYTLYTRAQKTNFLVGSPDAIRFAIENNVDEQRYSGLEYRLRHSL